MSAKEKDAAKVSKDDAAPQPAKDGNLRQVCTGNGSGSRFLNVWSN